MRSERPFSRGLIDGPLCAVTREENPSASHLWDRLMTVTIPLMKPSDGRNKTQRRIIEQNVSCGEDDMELNGDAARGSEVGL